MLGAAAKSTGIAPGCINDLRQDLQIFFVTQAMYPSNVRDAEVVSNMPSSQEGGRIALKNKKRTVFAICSAVESPLILGEWYLFEWTQNSTNWDC